MALFTKQEQQEIKEAVAAAEKNTSGEIRVCVEKTCSEEVLDRAVTYFKKLDMHKTKLRNGVLIYLSTDDRKFAIIGDAGIHEAVPDNFWDHTKELMLKHFKNGDLKEGIISGLKMAGEQLHKYFPSSDNNNELPDDIAFMDGK